MRVGKWDIEERVIGEGTRATVGHALRGRRLD